MYSCPMVGTSQQGDRWWLDNSSIASSRLECFLVLVNAGKGLDVDKVAEQDEDYRSKDAFIRA